MIGLLRRPAFETPCTVTVEQSAEAFHAHVKLAGDVRLGPGDRVTIAGDDITVPFGASMVLDRTARVEPAGPLLRAWIKLTAHFEFGELYEVSFTTGRLS